MTNHSQTNYFLRSVFAVFPGLFLTLLFVPGIQECHSQVVVAGPGASVVAIGGVNLESRTTGCDGNSVLIDAGAGYSSYLWSTGAATQSITVWTNGQYTVTVTDLIGNVSTDSIDVDFLTHFTPVIYLTDLGSKQYTFWTGGAPGVDTWNWNFGDGYGSTNPVANHTFASSGSYTICVDVTNACFTETACKTINTLAPVQASGNKRQVTDEQLNRVEILPYPNPSTNGIFFLRNGQMNKKYRITDTKGMTVLNYDPLPDEYGEVKLDLSHFGSGVYILSAIGDSGTSHQKIIISKE